MGQVAGGILHHAHLRKPLPLVEQHVAGQEGVLAPDHHRTGPVQHLRHLCQGHLVAGGRGDQHTADGSRVVAEVPGVAGPDIVPLPPLHGSGHGHTAQGYLDVLLHVRHIQPVAAEGLPVQVDLQIGLA